MHRLACELGILAAELWFSGKLEGIPLDETGPDDVES